MSRFTKGEVAEHGIMAGTVPIYDAEQKGSGWCALAARSQVDGFVDLLNVASTFGLTVVEPEDRHRGPRVRVRGDVVNEETDDRGDYAEIELRES